MSRSLKGAGALAILASVLLVTGTVLHPGQADPNDSLAAFAECAADSRGGWVLSHLLQLGGVAANIAALILVAQAFPASAWSRLSTLFATASLAVAAVLQAVDGVALKSMADQWAAAPAAEKSALFSAALAVRQIEIGLDSLLAVVFGIGIVAFGLMLGGRVLEAATVLVGLVSVVAGVLVGIGGYSDEAMFATMVSGIGLVLWSLALGLFIWAGHMRPLRSAREEQ